MRIEFEFQSRRFLAHGHDPKGCDLIVCWKVIQKLARERAAERSGAGAEAETADRMAG